MIGLDLGAFTWVESEPSRPRRQVAFLDYPTFCWKFNIVKSMTLYYYFVQFDQFNGILELPCLSTTILFLQLSFEVFHIFLKKYITGKCNSYLYSKSDGSIKCGSTLEHGLMIAQASDQCAQIGAIIPDLLSPNDQQIVNIIGVSIHILIKYWSQGNLSKMRSIIFCPNH